MAAPEWTHYYEKKWESVTRLKDRESFIFNFHNSYPDGWNNLAYCNNRVTDCIDWLGAGSLTINSDSNGASSSLSTSGHAWLSYTDDEGTTTTFGTWGNDPGGLGNGLHYNLESGRTSEVSRTVTLTTAQEIQLLGFVMETSERGEDAWGYFDNCAGFAVEGWELITNEDLSGLLVTTPTILVSNIRKINE